ncbi:hypothetical protein KA089_00430 [Candidatus Woesebacteria bacterium]|nr:hypothetical protein [Candidatus Woesebacteria bacterium]
MNLELAAFPEPEKASIEEGLPSFVNNPEEATAMNCSACGAARLRGAPMCLHCGSGLESEVLFDLDRLRQTADELNWQKDLDDLEFKEGINKAISISKERGKPVFILIQGIPLVIQEKDDLTIDKIRDNLAILSKLKRRKELGDLWYQALKRFNELQKRLSALPPNTRQEMHHLQTKRPEFTRIRKAYEQSFLGNVDFKSVEDEMDIYPGNDADKLNKYIDNIDEIINSLGKSA